MPAFDPQALLGILGGMGQAYHDYNTNLIQNQLQQRRDYTQTLMGIAASTDSPEVQTEAMRSAMGVMSAPITGKLPKELTPETALPRIFGARLPLPGWVTEGGQPQQPGAPQPAAQGAPAQPPIPGIGGTFGWGPTTPGITPGGSLGMAAPAGAPAQGAQAQGAAPATGAPAVGPPVPPPVGSALGFATPGTPTPVATAAAPTLPAVPSPQARPAPGIRMTLEDQIALQRAQAEFAADVEAWKQGQMKEAEQRAMYGHPDINLARAREKVMEAAARPEMAGPGQYPFSMLPMIAPELFPSGTAPSAPPGTPAAPVGAAPGIPGVANNVAPTAPPVGAAASGTPAGPVPDPFVALGFGPPTGTMIPGQLAPGMPRFKSPEEQKLDNAVDGALSALGRNDLVAAMRLHPNANRLDMVNALHDNMLSPDWKQQVRDAAAAALVPPSERKEQALRIQSEQADLAKKQQEAQLYTPEAIAATASELQNRPELVGGIEQGRRAMIETYIQRHPELGMHMPRPFEQGEQTTKDMARKTVDAADNIMDIFTAHPEAIGIVPTSLLKATNLTNEDWFKALGKISGSYWLANAQAAGVKDPEATAAAAQKIATQLNYLNLQEGRTQVGGRVATSLMDDFRSAAAQPTQPPKMFWTSLRTMREQGLIALRQAYAQQFQSDPPQGKPGFGFGKIGTSGVWDAGAKKPPGIGLNVSWKSVEDFAKQHRINLFEAAKHFTDMGFEVP